MHKSLELLQIGQIVERTTFSLMLIYSRNRNAGSVCLRNLYVIARHIHYSNTEDEIV